MAFQFQLLICHTSDHHWQWLTHTAFHKSILICHAFFPCQDQDLIPHSMASHFSTLICRAYLASFLGKTQICPLPVWHFISFLLFAIPLPVQAQIFTPWLYSISVSISYLPYPFLARPRLDSLFPALISSYGISISILNCHTLAQDSCLIPFYSIAVPQSTTSSGNFYGFGKLQWYKPRPFFGRLEIHPPPLPLHLNS